MLLEPYTDQWAILLETRKRDGSWVGTPVNIAVAGDRAYIGTPQTTAKVRRLRNFPDVRIAPSTLRGKPTGPRLRARARLLDGVEAGAAARHMARKYRIVYGILVPLELRVRRARGLYYELTSFRPAEAADTSGGYARAAEAPG